MSGGQLVAIRGLEAWYKTSIRPELLKVGLSNNSSNQLLSWSFLVSKECLLACVPRFERKNKLYRCSLLVVSKMYQIAGKRSGRKSMVVLLYSCLH